MTELTFVGAAGTVTGSKHLVTIDGHHLFVDCGLFQGPREVEALNLAPLPVPAAEMDAVVITHGHLDHVGYLPRLVRDGYRGPIYCTPATADVMEIVLEDAAHIQSHMHDRGFHHERSHSLAPFFTAEDVSATLRQVKTVALETDFTVCGATVRYHYAGHIVGAAYVDMRAGGPADDLLGRPRPVQCGVALRPNAARIGRYRRLRGDIRRSRASSRFA